MHTLQHCTQNVNTGPFAYTQIHSHTLIQRCAHTSTYTCICLHARTLVHTKRLARTVTAADRGPVDESVHGGQMIWVHILFLAGGAFCLLEQSKQARIAINSILK